MFIINNEHLLNSLKGILICALRKWYLIRWVVWFSSAPPQYSPRFHSKKTPLNNRQAVGSESKMSFTHERNQSDTIYASSDDWKASVEMVFTSKSQISIDDQNSDFNLLQTFSVRDVAAVQVHPRHTANTDHCD